MTTRYWPLEKGRIVTSPFGNRDGGFHAGVDFGFPGGSGKRPVYAIQSGTVIYHGAAQGYGGPDPAGWLVIDSDDSQGGGVLEYGHIIRLPHIKTGSKVVAGEQIAIINPQSSSNGGTAPHLHLSDHPYGYSPAQKQDPLRRLAGALDPGTAKPKEPAPVTNKPDFNEYPRWTTNRQNRNKTKIDLFLLHTQEGPGNADSLANYLISTENGNNPVSYHYTVSEDPKDHGVTVVDVVDTDYASYSVANSNNRSINLCFAGSRAGWSRAQWLQIPRAIDVAAYLAVADCKKYGIPTNVIVPPYNKKPPGISDHRYCTKYLKDGNTHTDLGDGFPWDIFAAAVAKYAGTAPAPAVTDDLISPAVLKLLADQFL